MKMKKRPFYKQITFVVPAKVLGGVLLMMTLIISAVIFTFTQYANKNITSNVAVFSRLNSDNVLSYMTVSVQNGQSMSSETTRRFGERLKNYADGDNIIDIRAMMEFYMRDPRVFSTYIALRPTNANKNGLSLYAYRETAGSEKALFDLNHDYDIYGNADYFAPAFETGLIHITEPYEYTLSNGNIVWLVTVSTPLYSADGKMLGVANCDFLSTAISELEFEYGGYESANVSVLTGQLSYLSNHEDQSKIGQPVESLTDEIAEAVQNGRQYMYEEAGKYTIFAPIRMEGTDLNWSSRYTVSKSEVMKERNNSIFLIIGITLIGLLLLALFGVRMIRKIFSPVKEIVKYVDALGQGELDASISVKVDNEFADIVDGLGRTSLTWKTYVNEISRMLGAISEKDLTTAPDAAFIGDFAPIQDSLERINDSLNDVMGKIGSAAQKVASGADQISNASQNLSQGSTEQASAVEELSATAQHIHNQAVANNENAQRAAELVQEAGTEVENSNRQMKALTAAMADMTEKSKKIGQIVKTIEDIAFQTNILALNAAVEAARAGVAGKGFAVVADEVGNLATKSSNAANETTKLIDETIQAINNGNRIATETARLLIEVVDTTKSAVLAVDAISEASNAQAKAVNQITEGISQVSRVVQTNAATAEETAASSLELQNEANLLEQELQEFSMQDALVLCNVEN